MWKKLRRRIKARVFKIMRPIFVPDVDPREDFNCGHCGEPVLTRVLVCSDACGEAMNSGQAPLL